MRATPDSTLADPQQIIADLQRQLAECRAERDEALAERDEAQRRLAERTAERDEALEQQTATAEVLQVINSSPGDLAPVFDAMLDKALELCGAAFGALWTYDGEQVHAAAVRGAPPPFAEFLRRAPHPVGPDNAHGRLLRGEPVVHIADVADDEAYRSGDPVRRNLVELGGGRTLLAVPLRKEDAFLGDFVIYRQEVRPFTDKQIGLLQNFAAQAVIAMENARLITETREALEQQTATAEVLEVINSSPGDLAPVFDAILEKALRLCDAGFGHFRTYDGERFPLVAVRGDQRFVDVMHQRAALAPGPHHPLARIIAGEDVNHIADAADSDAYRNDPRFRELVDTGVCRSLLGVALRKDKTLLGYVVVYRQEVRPFSDKQIALLQNFASQAVIAMENARLLGELRERTHDLEESLEYQTATSDVLQVISRSTFDLQPVLQTVLDTAVRLCRAGPSEIFRTEGDGYRFAVGHGMTPEYEALERKVVIHPDPGTLVGRTAVERRVVHVLDAWTDPLYSQKEEARIGNFHTMLGVPLMREGEVAGVIALSRRVVEPFSEREIQLVTTFADQAVIAIENTRLITETREALEQQTATAEVLQVINSSPGDLAPVFDAMLEKAMRLCEAAFGILLVRDGSHFRTAALHGVPPALAEFLSRTPQEPGKHTAVGRMLAGEDFVHFEDMTKEPAYQLGDRRQRAFVELGGTRTYVAVALRKDGSLVGTIGAYRQEVRPFTDNQIALLQNFAAQAVIAMENARLLTETREALDQQTATAEVLQVINSSPGDLAPVFDAMLEKALRLCEAAFGLLIIWDGEQFHRVAFRGVPAELIEAMRQPLKPVPGGFADRLVCGERVIAVTDLLEAGDQPIGPGAQLLVRFGARSYVGVALRKDEALLGAIVIYRREVRPFSDKEIALLENFAAQAVIAMENARLLGELRDRTHDLEASLEYQTAMSDVLQVISRSTFDLQGVLDTLIATAAQLCNAEMANVLRRDGDVYREAAAIGWPAGYKAFIEAYPLAAGRSTLTGRVALEGRAVHIADITADPEYTLGQAASLGRARTMLGVPLLREGEIIGVIILARTRVEPFTERQIELVRTFADQAVIAIENTRLITETREALERQTATAEILEVINRSPGDLAPVFGALLDKALTLCGGNSGFIRTYDGEAFHLGAMRGVPPEMTELLNQPRRPPFTGTALGRLVAGESVVEVANIGDQPGYHNTTTIRVMADAGIARTMLWVALRKEGALVGFISVFRNEIRPFSDKQIALLQNFAAQAVIAIDNARLLNEIRQRQAELRVTFDNMGDGVAMFDSELRLAAWNLNFQRILDLPDPLLSERPIYSDYIRALAERGEFGSSDIEQELKLRLEATEQELRLERTRPDGRVIEVRRNAVPGGGFVLIIGDITERKRAEAEIHVARDTAEKALQELQAAQASLLHAQKMAALGQLTAGIAHEIKNPLNFVNNFAELSGELLLELKETTAPAVAALGDDERATVDEVVEMLRGNLDKIAEHGKRADGIVKSMLEHSRGVSGERRVVDLNGLIEEALNLAYHGARAQDASFNITLEREFDRGLALTELAPQEMTRVFLNLFGNGFYATTQRQRDGAGADFRPTLTVATRDLGDAVEVRVRDNGTGIQPEIRDKLFQPFVTTKPTGEGTGLGLSIAWDIVTQQHGGTIEVDSRLGGFTEFTIRLPRQAMGGAV